MRIIKQYITSTASILLYSGVSAMHAQMSFQLHWDSQQSDCSPSVHIFCLVTFFKFPSEALNLLRRFQTFALMNPCIE